VKEHKSNIQMFLVNQLIRIPWLPCSGIHDAPHKDPVVIWIGRIAISDHKVISQLASEWPDKKRRFALERANNNLWNLTVVLSSLTCVGVSQREPTDPHRIFQLPRAMTSVEYLCQGKQRKPNTRADPTQKSLDIPVEHMRTSHSNILCCDHRIHNPQGYY
jgi:hypothetical protein